MTHFRRLIVVASLLALAGCESPLRQQCRLQAGPEPEIILAHGFGVLGAIAAAADPERDAWNKRFNRCYWGGDSIFARQ